MKNFIAVLSLGILLFVGAGCKKEADIDPRDQYIGEYKLTVSSTYSVLNSSAQTTPVIDTDALTIIKENNPKELRFIFLRKILTATLDGNNFHFAPQTYKAYSVSTGEYVQNFQGEGAFTSKGITLNLTMNVNFSATQVREVATMKGIRL